MGSGMIACRFADQRSTAALTRDHAGLRVIAEGRACARW
jgi:hypothetical protein